MKKVQQGFTLIELMIVVAIIGILAAIAIPQYQDYITRAKWQDNIAKVQSFKTAIAECLQNQGGCMANCSDSTAVSSVTGATFPATSGNLAGLTYTGSIMVLTGSAAVSLCTVTLTPQSGPTSVSWSFLTGGGCNKSKTGVG